MNYEFDEVTGQVINADTEAIEGSTTVDELAAVDQEAVDPHLRELDEDETLSVLDVCEPSLQNTVAIGFQAFMGKENSGAMVMAAATVLALVIANTGAYGIFDELWHQEVGFFAGAWELTQSLKHWIDDALMVIFFFVVGLEIKREVLVGELSSIKSAAVPIIAAVGGMVVPAGIYFALNAGGPGAHGWGIPMATDIAFTLGVLAMLGSRVPTSLKVFLTALAIADDIGAILVIAIFYSSNVSMGWLAFALVPMLLMFMLNKLRIDAGTPYILLTIVLWFAFLNSGIHATIAGVLAAMLIPVRARITPLNFTRFLRSKVREVETSHLPGRHILSESHQVHVANDIAIAAAGVVSPLQRIEHALMPLSTFVILPLFALANAEIRVIGGNITVDAIGIGVFLGLVVGKPLGVLAMTWLAVKSGIGKMSPDLDMGWIFGGSMLAGIGFTMSIFVANLAFRGPDAAEMMAEAKIAILVASVVAGVVGYLFLRWYAARKTAQAEGASCAI